MSRSFFIKQILFLVFISVGALGLVAGLWRHGWILAVSELAILVFAHAYTKCRYLVVSSIVFALAPLAEIIAIWSGAWHYTKPSFLGINFWLPFVWATAAVYILTAQDTLDKCRKLRSKKQHTARLHVQ